MPASGGRGGTRERRESSIHLVNYRGQAKLKMSRKGQKWSPPFYPAKLKRTGKREDSLVKSRGRARRSQWMTRSEKSSR